MSQEDVVSAFVRTLGLNKKQVAVAGEKIGLSPDQMTDRLRGKRPLQRSERLAMMAAFCGLPEFDPAIADKTDQELAKVYAAARALRAELKKLQGIDGDE